MVLQSFPAHDTLTRKYHAVFTALQEKDWLNKCHFKDTVKVQVQAVPKIARKDVTSRNVLNIYTKTADMSSCGRTVF
jgi:hypothetical protein